MGLRKSLTRAKLQIQWHFELAYVLVFIGLADFLYHAIDANHRWSSSILEFFRYAPSG